MTELSAFSISKSSTDDMHLTERGPIDRSVCMKGIPKEPVA